MPENARTGGDTNTTMVIMAAIIAIAALVAIIVYAMSSAPPPPDGVGADTGDGGTTGFISSPGAFDTVPSGDEGFSAGMQMSAGMEAY